jgi:hypothetical protein
MEVIMRWQTPLVVLTLLFGTLTACSAQLQIPQQLTATVLVTDTALPTPTLLLSPSLSQTTTAFCPVSLPNGKGPRDDTVNSASYLANEDNTLFTIPWPQGTVTFRPGGPGFIEPDGSLSMKWPWIRQDIKGQVVVTGRRLDAPGPLVRAIMGCCHGENTAARDCCYGNTGFIPSALIFPTPGCWEVTGSVGNHRLTFVTLVVKLDQ